MIFDLQLLVKAFEEREHIIILLDNINPESEVIDKHSFASGVKIFVINILLIHIFSDNM